MLRNDLFHCSFALSLFLQLLFLSQEVRGETSLGTLYQAAKAEGKVEIWSPVDGEEILMLAEAFNKVFPGVKVNHFEIRAAEYVQRFIVEAKQGTVALDIGTGKTTDMIPLLDRDLIQPYNDWTKTFKDIIPSAVSQDGKLVTHYHLLYPVAYNTRTLTSEDTPRSWEDLLDARWKGKIIVEPRANAFAYLGLKWGREKMVNYLKKLRAQSPIYVKGGTGVAQQVVAGVAPLAIGAYVHKISQMQKDGAPIDWAKKISPLGVADNVMFVAKGAKHPNAAKLFIGWLASEKAQRIINERLFRGQLFPGSRYFAMTEIEKNRVELLTETVENYREAAVLNKAAVKALGVLR